MSPAFSSFAKEIKKLAEGSADKSREEVPQAPPEKSPPSPLWIAARNLALYPIGIGAGAYLGGHLLDKGYTAATGKDLRAMRYTLPALVAAGAMGNHLYNRWKETELKEMQDAYKARRDNPKGRSPGQ